jgi:hypothetical protein
MTQYPLRDETGKVRSTGINISELRAARNIGIYREQSGIERQLQAYKSKVTCDMTGQVLEFPTTLVVIHNDEGEIVAMYATIGDEDHMFLCYCAA